jgi:thymidylate synthase (FAD)
MAVGMHFLNMAEDGNLEEGNRRYINYGIGFVEKIEIMGDDLTVVNAARVSFEKESHEMTEQDVRLIKYLAKNNHISPFFHPQIRLRLKMPIFVAREWFRHTVGFARNEVSRRYVTCDPECWVPPVIREFCEFKKQGSKDVEVKDSREIKLMIADSINTSCELYNELIQLEVAPEIARCVLPQSMYTEFIETGSLYAYLRLCHLRMQPDAQKEIQIYSNLVYNILIEHFPVSAPLFV